MKSVIRNLVIGVSTGALLAGGVAVAAFADTGTSTAGTLTVYANQFSNSTLDIAAEYTEYIGDDVAYRFTISQAGTQVGSGDLDASSGVIDKVISGIQPGETYQVQAEMIWANGATKFSNPVTVNTDYLTTITTEDVQHAADGSYSITTQTVPDPQAQILPTRVAAKTVSHRRAFKLTWAAAGVNGGSKLAGYRVQVFNQYGKQVALRNLGLNVRELTFDRLAAKQRYYVNVTAVNQAKKTNTRALIVRTK